MNHHLHQLITGIRTELELQGAPRSSLIKIAHQILGAVGITQMNVHEVGRWSRKPHRDSYNQKEYDKATERVAKKYQTQEAIAELVQNHLDGGAFMADKSNVYEKNLNADGSITTTYLRVGPVGGPDDLLEDSGLDPDQWTVSSFSSTRWAVPMKITRDGQDEPTLVETYRVNAKFLPNWPARELRVLAEELLSDFKAARVVPSKPEMKLSIEKGKYALLVNIMDAHIGRLVYDNDGKITYTPEEAVSIGVEAAREIIETAVRMRGHLAEICIPFGNDSTQTDGSRRTTTAGTAQDYLGPWQMNFRYSTDMYRRIIEIAAQHADHVTALAVPGNHESDGGFYQGEVIATRFMDLENITVDNGLDPRKYWKFGPTLIGFCHGKDEKHKDLLNLMINERPQDFTSARFREFHVGHLHNRSGYEYGVYFDIKGLKVFINPALCPTDHWHKIKGYIGAGQGADGYVYCMETGPAGTIPFHVL